MINLTPFLAEVCLLLSERDELRPHLCPDGLDDGLDLLADVEVEPEHLVPHKAPLLQVEVHALHHSGNEDRKYFRLARTENISDWRMSWQLIKDLWRKLMTGQILETFSNNHNLEKVDSYGRVAKYLLHGEMKLFSIFQF